MNETYGHGLLGGALIGAAAVIMYAFNGRIMGISGIFSRLWQKPSRDTWWRLCFIAGLILGGVFGRFPVDVQIKASNGVILIAGFLVGFGTVLGNGCTSGHGICGIARFSKRSIVATVIFMATGILTVYLMKRWGF